VTSKECGSCTKCCEGYVSGEAHGHRFSLGNPCFFLIKDKGCTIYEDRPKMCSKFRCLWLDDEDVPDYVKPIASGTILMKWPNSNVLYYFNAGNDIKPEVKAWAENYAGKNNLVLLANKGM
jgi:hypothetical protein